jgi:hypothetical protein
MREVPVQNYLADVWCTSAMPLQEYLAVTGYTCAEQSVVGKLLS